MRVRGIHFSQLVVASLVGISGGFYIFNPIYFVQRNRTELEKREHKITTTNLNLTTTAAADTDRQQKNQKKQ